MNFQKIKTKRLHVGNHKAFYAVVYNGVELKAGLVSQKEANHWANKFQRLLDSGKIQSYIRTRKAS